MKEKIARVLTKLSENPERRVFHSEADFQFQLAWGLKEQEGFDVILEYSENISNNERNRVDIVIVKNNKYIPIELKYFTKPHNNYKQLKQQNDTWRTYDYFEDLMRVESFVNTRDNSDEGYTIVLSNYNFFWQGNVKENVNYYDYRILHNREIKPRDYKWADSEAKSVKGTRREKKIKIKGNYKFKWDTFFKEKDLEFKYMINRYSKNHK